MLLKGKISKILFNNGKGYMLFSIVIKDPSSIDEDKINPQYPRNITVFGNNIMGIEEGYVIEINGDWEYNDNGRYWPWQFKVSSFSIVEADTPETVIKFLSTLPGIGEKLANALFAEFGLDIYDVIESDERTGNRQLTIVRGISSVREDAIIKAYHDKKVFKETLTELSKYNIGETKTKNIIAKHGDNALSLIRQNPYELANEKIITFTVADTMAVDYGIPHDSSFRIEAAVKNVLDVRAASLGHTFLDFDDVLRQTSMLLKSHSKIRGNDVDINVISSCIANFSKEGNVVNEEGRIYLSFRYNNENFVAKKLASRSKLPSKFAEATEEQIEKCVEEAQKTLKVTLASGQKNAVITAIKNTTVVITGGPGTGKTTTLKVLMLTMDYLSDMLGKERLNKVLAAPTGMAAKRMKEATNMDASTIHRLLEFTPFADGEIRAKNEEDPIEGDMLIIDESSMLDIDLFAMLMHAVQDKTELIFLGDIDQLPSVGPGDVLHDIIDSNVIAVARLTQTYRQGAQSPILANAKKINSGDTDLIFDKPDEFTFIEIPDSDADPECEAMQSMAMQVFYEQFILKGGDINKIQVLLPMRRSTKVSVDVINPELQNTVNATISKSREMVYGFTRFRKGDKVMQLTNNYEKWVFNGDVGVIVEVAPNSNKVMVNFGGEHKEYLKDELEQLRHSYATTIHKSQGSEYEVVIIVLTNKHKLMLQRNLLYTGLTRAKKKAIIIGDRDALNYAIGNVSNRSRNSMLKLKMQEYANK